VNDEFSVLPRDLLERSAVEVAPLLLGCVVVHDSPEGWVAVRLTEVEAYAGEGEDPGSHAHRGETARNAVMFGPPGHLYVYFTYGMHWCANVVCGKEGEGVGVLLRALEPVAGLELMRASRPKARTDRDLCRGPGRLSQAMGISGEDDGDDLRRGRIRVLDDGVGPPGAPHVGPRIGISVATHEPWRWRVARNRFVSC